MPLARAFTKRVKRSVDQVQIPMRSNTTKYPTGTIKRSMISLPTELISTTNVQALNAPDIRSVSGSSGSSTSSFNDSDFSTIDRGFLNNAGTDTSSIESSPITPDTPPSHHGSSFFDTKYKLADPISIVSDVSPEVPAIPQRAPSHSKKAHVELSRQRTSKRMSPPPTVISQSPVRPTTDIFSSTADPSHPFGRELAQVNEVAHEFGATSALIDDEEQEILSKGLCKFGVNDYISEIAGMYSGGVYEDQLGPIANPWL